MRLLMKKIILTVAVAFCVLETVHAQVTTLPPSYSEKKDDNLNIYRAEPEIQHNLIHTKIAISFDYQKQEAEGEAWITLKPHFYATDKLVLDAKNMVIKEVALAQSKALKKLKYSYDDQQLFITLDKSYQRSETFDIYVKYVAQPNKVTHEGSEAIHDAKGLYFINPTGADTDKPIQIWTQGETESSSGWFPTIDKTNQKSTSEIYMTVPDQYVTLSNGVLKNQTKNSNGTRTDYWKMEQKHAPYLFFMGIGDFAVVKDQWNQIPVNYYVEKEYAAYAKQIFGDTPAMMQFFSDLLDYPYPWPKYDQMVGRDFVSGAMENTTATLHKEDAQQKPGQLIDENIWESVIAHELFHHWFGDLVTAESWSNLTVNESFANYSEYLWFEHKYGKDKAEDHRLADLSAYQSGNGYEKDLVRIHYNSREDMFDDISYNKGGMGVLHMLRNYLGDDAFFKGLNRYLKQHEYGKAEAAQLRLALEEVSGRDLNWFFNQWYYGSGHPKLTVQQSYDAQTKKVTLKIHQTQKNLFEFPLDIDVIIDGKPIRHQVWVAKEENSTLTFDAAKKPDVVLLNPEKVLLAEIEEKRSVEENIAAYLSSGASYGIRKDALDGLYDQQTNARVTETLRKALTDPYYGLRKEVIEKLSPESVKKTFTAELKTIAEKDKQTLVQAAALTALWEADIKDTPLFEKALKSPSFSVQSAALSYLIKNNPKEIERYIKNIDDEVLAKNQDVSLLMIPQWIRNNDWNKAKLVAESAAFYYLIKFQDPDTGKVLEDAFDWIMQNDTPDATNRIATVYRQVKKELGDNPQVGMIVKIMITNGLTQKKAAQQKNPASQSLQEQVKLLETLLSEF